MTQEHSLISREQSIALTPQDVVAGATAQARLLMDIVDKTGCFQLISGKKYLQVEAWETIGAFNSVHAVTEAIIPIIKDGATVGYDAKVNLINRDGFVVGSAIMPCYFTENACKGKEGDAKDKAAKSAAQTFATSKAYRMNYSYIAILAGYEPTPAEEMISDEKPIDKSQHYCQEHDTPFFKKGKMKSYAHPIEGTDQWCHEHKNSDVKPTVSAEEQESLQTTAVAEPPQSTELAEPIPSQPEPVEEAKYFIDMEWLEESLKTLRDKKLQNWIESNLLSYMKINYKVDAKTVLEGATKLEKGQAAHFIKRVQDALDMS